MGTPPRDLNPAAPTTSLDLLAATIRRHPERAAMRYRADEADGWQRLTWLELGVLVAEAAAWLDEHGDPRRISVVGPASPAHTVLELAALLRGATVHVAYADATPDEHERVLGIVQPDLVADEAALTAAWSAWQDRAADGAADRALAGFDGGPVVETLAAVRAAAPTDGELLLQSTGTTGPAKVLVLDEAAVVAAAWAVRDEVDHPHPRFVAFLPSGHISHQLINVFVATLLAGEVAYGGGVDTLLDDLAEVQPTVLFGAPMLFQEVHDELATKLGGGALGRLAWRRVERARDRMVARGEIRRGDAPLVGRLLGGVAARQLGLQQARELFSGTSPLDPELHAFCAAIGWYVRNTYGVSECGGAATISRRDRMVPGELGQAVEGIEVDLGADGEIVVAGRTLLRGFLGQPAREPGAPLGSGDLGAWAGDGSTLLFRGRRSSQVTTPAGPSTLDAIEADAERSFPGTKAVLLARGDALELLLTRGERFTGDLPTTENVDRWLAAEHAAGSHVAAVATVTVDERVLDAAAGEIGPTGKVRRWKVAQTRLPTAPLLNRV